MSHKAQGNQRPQAIRPTQTKAVAQLIQAALLLLTMVIATVQERDADRRLICLYLNCCLVSYMHTRLDNSLPPANLCSGC